MHSRKPPRRHACIRCVHSKVKCTPLENGGACERCARLDRECVFPDTSQVTRPKHNSKDRIDRLQEQVESLAAQLTKKDDESARTRSQLLNNRSSSTPPNSVLQFSPDAVPQESGHVETANDVFTRGILTLADADRLLGKFRASKMPQFPFIIVPPEMDIHTIRQQNPFLLLAIMTACLEDDLSLQRKLVSEIKAVISTRIVMKNERNLDLLLGLLIHLAWYHYHYQTVHTQMYLLLQTAITFVVDLGLDKESNFGMRAVYPLMQQLDKALPEASCHSSAGKRALLGCYYLYSISSIFRKQLFMRHTKWIDQCCEAFLESPEYPTDVLLKTYIDIQLLARRSEEILCPDNIYQSDSVRGFDWRMLDSLEREGKQIQTRLSQNELQGHWTLSLDLMAIPVYVIGHALRHGYGDFGSRHISQFQALFSSARDAIVSFLQLPSDAILHLPLCPFTTLWYCHLILSKLLLSCHSWPENARIERKVVYELGLATMHKFAAISAGGDIWENSRRVVGSMLSWLEKHDKQRPHSEITRVHTVSFNPDESPRLHMPDNAGDANSVDISQPAPWHGRSAESHDTNSDVNWSVMEKAATEDVEGQAQDYWDQSMWEQVLEDFAMIPIMLPF